jgi:hypothetical protein
MEYDKKLANLEDLCVLCENRSRAEDTIFYEAVAFATKYTDSNLVIWQSSIDRFLFTWADYCFQ